MICGLEDFTLVNSKHHVDICSVNYVNLLAISVRPKSDFGIGNRNLSVSVSEPKSFFSKTETFFFKRFQTFLISDLNQNSGFGRTLKPG